MSNVMPANSRKPGRDEYAKLNLIGNSKAFCDTLHLINRLATVDATVLIEGETGTGKELAARALHYLSMRRNYPFIPINCGALPENLLESELFGHVRGDFTDAKSRHDGLVAQAEGGTLFLDEVEAMSPRAQIVLLRFLQDHKYRPVGGHSLFGSNVRVVAATNVDLEGLVQRNAFRQDLLFRLGMLCVKMPPLRQRSDDIVLLAEHFLRRFALEHSKPYRGLHPDGVGALLAYAWPGNVRELENLVLRTVVLTDGDVILLEPSRRPAPELKREGLFETDQTFQSAKALAIARFERSYVGDLLTRTKGNISLAARICGKDRSSLNKLVKKYGLTSAIDQAR
jgi:DNA-binding NtrC family response regulator